MYAMHDELIRRLNETKTMSIVGMCKNAGKTTMLNWLLTAGHLRGTLGLTSIGRDGESTDVVTGTEKPGIFVREGTLIATAKDMLRLGDVTKEILMTTGIPTPLGEVVIMRARSAGYVQLAGPSITTQLRSVSESFFALGAEKSVIDGALGRKSLGARAVAEGVILCTGASYNASMEKVIADYAPEVVLFGASSIGRDLAPSVSATVHTGLTADCTHLAIGDVDKTVTNAADKAKVEAKIAELGQDVTVEDNSKSITNPKTGAVVDVVNVKYIYHKQLRMTRPAFGGNIIATIACLQHRPQMATVRPGVMQALAADDSRKGEVIKLDIKPTNNVEVLETVKSTKTSKDITEAKILVSAGRGILVNSLLRIGSAEKVAMVQDLADALDGDIACSRAVIDAGWMDKDRQVGQTGKTVRPELYVACGISGAIQHAAGMEGSDYIIAINKEETAPIFDIADLGIIGDVNAILPKLTEAIKKYKAEQAGK